MPLLGVMLHNCCVYEEGLGDTIQSKSCSSPDRGMLMKTCIESRVRKWTSIDIVRIIFDVGNVDFMGEE